MRITQTNENGITITSEIQILNTETMQLFSDEFISSLEINLFAEEGLHEEIGNALASQGYLMTDANQLGPDFSCMATPIIETCPSF
jgi:hypothetical protein